MRQSSNKRFRWLNLETQLPYKVGVLETLEFLTSTDPVELERDIECIGSFGGGFYK